MGRIFYAIVAAILGGTSLPNLAIAADVSATEPDFLLPCEDVFQDGKVAPGYIDMIADFAFPRGRLAIASEAVALGADPAYPDRLSKWPGKLRMVVRSEVPVTRDAFTSLRLNMFGWGKLDIDYAWDNAGTVAIGDGDLLVYVATGPLWTNDDRPSPKLERILQDFYGPGRAAMHERQQWDSSLGFVDIVRGPGMNVRRAIVALSADSLWFDHGNWLFELLTSALNPNPGNAAYSGLPGGTPEEKRIYDKVWASSTVYGLMWGKEFQPYMAVLYDEGVKPGMTRGQLVAAATEILNRPKLQKKIFVAHNCKNEQ